MKIKEIILTIASVVLIIIGAYLSVQFGALPIVLTNFFIILVGLLMGWKKSLIAILIYIALGALGLPVFNGGKGGFGHLIGLTGGFIFGFIPLALLSGLASNKNIVLKIVLVIAGSLLVYLVGFPWALNHYNNVIAVNAGRDPWTFTVGMEKLVIPFLLPDLLKAVVAIILSQILKPVLKPFLNRDEE